jgi:hypothetical protein
MMLVEHEIEAELVGDAIFVEVTVIEIGADLRIEIAVQDRHRVFLSWIERRMSG